jgi:hypothetical protein
MLANLRALFGCVVDIILLRRGPEALPASQGLLVILVALNVGGSLIMAAASSVPPVSALLQTLVGCAVMILWFHAALMVAQKRERLLQTLNAIFGVSALFLPVVIPLLRALTPYLEKPDPNVPPPAALALVTFFVLIWLLVVQVRIVREAFECRWIGAILLLVGEFFAAGFVSMLLFGVPAKPA